MYQKTIEEVLRYYQVDASLGLSREAVNKSALENGRNVLVSQKKKTLHYMLYEQLKEVMVLILLVAMAISLFLHEYVDALVILLVIVINTSVGILQSYKAERAMEALVKLAKPKAIVLRRGKHEEIDAMDIVVGDLVVLETGRLVPCDLRLISSVNLKVDESALSGESEPILKEANSVCKEKTALHDQRNMAFMSTYVTSGRGSGVCVAVGMQSEIGKIAGMLSEINTDKTPLQERLSKLGGMLGYVCVGICTLMLVIGVLQKKPFMEMLLIAISLAVAAIPEGLAAIVSIVLALGVQRMSKKQAIVRKLVAVETLGCVSVICSDKTGTLTQNKMQVVDTYCNQGFQKPSSLFIQGFTLCNDVLVDEDHYIGDSMEVALCEYGASLGISKTRLEMQYPRIDEIPFDSKSKYMATVHKYRNFEIVFVKGALDIVLQMCTKRIVEDRVYELNVGGKELILQDSLRCTNKAKRVLALAYKKEYSHQNYTSELIFVGFVAFMDPPREEVISSIQACKQAGIRVVMITGDHPSTASTIAKQLAIIKDDKECMKGEDLDKLNDRELSNCVMKYNVYARVSPMHKVRLVKAYKSLGHVVAMSGDGVNDAPSLKYADIGIAMGKNGSDVTKAASDMILVDDNFATIVAAIEEGRNIYLNIQKTILFLLSCNIGEVVTLLLAILFLRGFPSPLTPIQILWVNLITDSFPSLALGIDPSQKGVMDRVPRNRNESLLGSQGIFYLLFNGVLIGTVSLVAFRYGLQYSITVGHTMTFMVLSISQLFHALNLMNVEKSIFKVGLWHNPYLVITIAIGILLQMAVCHLPIFQSILKTSALSLGQWGIVYLLSSMVILVNEIAKQIK